jgi:site-specific recombinase XerD
MPVGGRRVAWPIELWPEPDRLAWRQAQRTGDFLEPDGLAAAWSAATLHAAVGAYGRWLAYLNDHGGLDHGLGPGERLTPDAMRGYVTYLRIGRSSTTVASYIGVLSMMVQAMAADRDWRWLQAVQSRLRRRAEPTRNKRCRIVPVSDLLTLGLDLMAHAETTRLRSRRKTALEFRDGLMIALLAARPLRQRNFIAIEIDRHLVRTGAGYALCFAAGETKGRRALEFAFPAGLLPALARYLDHERPYLLGLRQTRGQSRQGTLGEPGGRLWITQYGTGFTAAAQTKALDKHTTARFGHHVNAHLFRDCAATSVATEDPEHARISAQILGHASFKTTERHYIVANANIATQSYHDQILAIRTGTRQRQRNCSAEASATPPRRRL